MERGTESRLRVESNRSPEKRREGDRKRPTAKVIVVSDDTHRRLKEYATRKGYKFQYVADEAVAQYLEGEEGK